MAIKKNTKKDDLQEDAVEQGQGYEKKTILASAKDIIHRPSSFTIRRKCCG